MPMPFQHHFGIDKVYNITMFSLLAPIIELLLVFLNREVYGGILESYFLQKKTMLLNGNSFIGSFLADHNHR
jgi:hypothetical protein